MSGNPNKTELNWTEHSAAQTQLQCFNVDSDFSDSYNRRLHVSGIFLFSFNKLHLQTDSSHELNLPTR